MLTWLPVILFGALVIGLFISLGVVVWIGSKPTGLPPAFPNETAKDIYRKL